MVFNYLPLGKLSYIINLVTPPSSSILGRFPSFFVVSLPPSLEQIYFSSFRHCGLAECCRQKKRAIQMLRFWESAAVKLEVVNPNPCGWGLT